MAPTRMLEAQKRNQLDYIFSRVPVDAGGVLFAIDKDSGEVLAHSDEKMAGSSMEDLGAFRKGDRRLQRWRIYSSGRRENLLCHPGERQLILGAGRMRISFMTRGIRRRF